MEKKKKVYTSSVVSSKGRLHPTQKDLGLMERYIEMHSREGEVVFDPYGGSMTSGVAAVRLGRRYIGVEIDEGYYRSGVERVRREIERGRGLF